MKKNHILPCWLFGTIAVFGSLSTLPAAEVFSENFDDVPPYTENAQPPAGPGMIHFGEWAEPGRSKLSGRVTSAKSLSTPMSLELTVDREDADCRAIGWFGTSNEETSTVTGRLTVKLAFLASQTGSSASFGVRNEGHQTAALVELTEKGGLDASFLGERVELAPSIDVDEWYYLEFIFPADQKTYTVNLYSEDGVTLLGSQNGRLSRRDAAEGGLAYVMALINTPGKSVYLDNITASEGNPD